MLKRPTIDDASSGDGPSHPTARLGGVARLAAGSLPFACRFGPLRSRFRWQEAARRSDWHYDAARNLERLADQGAGAIARAVIETAKAAFPDPTLKPGTASEEQTDAAFAEAATFGARLREAQDTLGRLCGLMRAALMSPGMPASKSENPAESRDSNAYTTAPVDPDNPLEAALRRLGASIEERLLLNS